MLAVSNHRPVPLSPAPAPPLLSFISPINLRVSSRSGIDGDNVNRYDLANLGLADTFWINWIKTLSFVTSGAYLSSLSDTRIVRLLPQFTSFTQSALVMLSFAYPIKAKASNKHWSSGESKVLFLFQKLSNKYIILSALSPVSVTRNHRETVPATCIFLAPISLCCKNLPSEGLWPSAVITHPLQQDPVISACVFILLFCQWTDCSALTPQAHAFKSVSVGLERWQPKMKSGNSAEVCRIAVRYPKQK